MTTAPTALLAMTPAVFTDLFTPQQRQRLRGLVNIDDSVIVEDFSAPEAAERLAAAEVLITGWGAPVLDTIALAGAPKLRAVVHVAGSVKPYLVREVWERGIAVTSCAEANAIPVAEYTVGAILLSGKRAFRIRHEFARTRRMDAGEWPWLGNYRRVIGVIGASRIGRRVLELLSAYEVDLLLYDPYVSAEGAARLGARKVELDELMAASDVVSVHAPSTDETRHLLDARRLALLRDGSVLINTSRGALIDTDALTVEVATGRIDAVVDVTDPEPLPDDSPLYDLPNVFLTPHIAGSLGDELARMAEMALDELGRWVRGLPFEQAVEASLLDVTA